MYDPGSREGQHLIAHEVAHTVQQRDAAPTTQTKLEVSSPSDGAEVAADHAADLAFSANPTAARAVVGRLGAPTLSRTPRSHVTAGSADEMTIEHIPAVVQAGRAEDIDNGSGTPIHAGQAGYARALLGATGARAESMAHNYSDALLHNLVPSFDGIDQFTRVRASEKDKFIDEATPASLGPITFDNAPSARARWRAAGTWCQERIGEAETDKVSEDETFSRYNAWVPRANGFFTSLERLQAQSWMVGHRNDTGSLAASLLAGLEEAEQVAHRAQTAFDGGNQAGNLPPLPTDASVAALSSETTLKAREMNTAYLRFQSIVINDRSESINAEGAADRARMEQINEVKNFVKNVGGVIDTTMSVVQGAPAAIANATELVQRTGAQINAGRNRRADMRGGEGQHNATYLTTDADGNMVVRDMQYGTDTGASGEATPSPGGGGFSMPSVGGALSAIADFAYAGEVREIQSRLDQIKSRMEGTAVAAAFTAKREIVQNLSDKLAAFALACRNLQARISERRQQYLSYGVALDNFARQDRGNRGSSPGANGDKFATIMVLTSAVRETVGIGNGAKSGFMSVSEIEHWARDINQRRSRSDCPMSLPDRGGSVRSFECSEAEWTAMSGMWSQVRGFNTYVDEIVSDLGPVEVRARSMMGPATMVDGQQRGLHQGGGSGDY